jgi:hypothetical protein
VTTLVSETEQNERMKDNDEEDNSPEHEEDGDEKENETEKGEKDGEEKKKEAKTAEDDKTTEVVAGLVGDPTLSFLNTTFASYFNVTIPVR